MNMYAIIHKLFQPLFERYERLQENWKSAEFDRQALAARNTASFIFTYLNIYKDGGYYNSIRGSEVENEDGSTSIFVTIERETFELVYHNSLWLKIKSSNVTHTTICGPTVHYLNGILKILAEYQQVSRW